MASHSNDDDFGFHDVEISSSVELTKTADAVFRNPSKLFSCPHSRSVPSTINFEAMAIKDLGSNTIPAVSSSARSQSTYLSSVDVVNAAPSDRQFTLLLTDTMVTSLPPYGTPSSQAMHPPSQNFDYYSLIELTNGKMGPGLESNDVIISGFEYVDVSSSSNFY